MESLIWFLILLSNLWFAVVLSELRNHQNYTVKDYSLNLSCLSNNSSEKVYSVDISHRNIETVHARVPNCRSVKYLNVSYNQLTEIFEFRFLQNIIELDLSHNKLIDVGNSFRWLRNLTVLNLSHNQLHTFEFYQFLGLHKLKEIDLRGNKLERFRCRSEQFITHCASIHFPWDKVKYKLDMSLYCISLTQLTISGNDMIYIPKPTTSEGLPCPNVGNPVQNILETLPFLSSSILFLHLSGHFVGNINCTSLQKFSSLEKFYLESTGLQDFDCNPFEPLKKLEWLDISGNKLTTLNISLLGDTLKNLDSFKAKNNKFHNVVEIIQELGALEPSIYWLDLSDNPIGKINGSIFRGFNKLGHLSLQNTNLVDFESNPFDGLNELGLIDLSHNNLVKPNFNGSLPQLCGLKLNNNRLIELAGVNPNNYPKLLELSIKDNPISCEYLKELKNMEWSSLYISSFCGL